jgi:hypothetical protein
MRGFRFWKCEAAAAALVFTVFPLFYFICARPHALSRERRTCGRSEAEEKAQEGEKNGTSGVHGGGYFAPRGFFYFGFLFTYAVPGYLSTYGRPITYLTGGPLVEVHSSSYFCFIPRPHSF